MALNFMMIPHSWLLFLSFLFVFHSSLIPLCHSQSGSPQNIETFYPTEASSPTQPPAPAPPSAVSSGSSSSNSKIAKAVAATAAATFVVSGLIFFLVHRCLRTRRRQEAVVPQSQINGFERIQGNVRGLIVDENGLDVVYWRKLQGRSFKGEFLKEVFRGANNKEHQKEEETEDQGKKSESVQEFPLLRGKSSTSHIPESDESNRITKRTNLRASAIPKRNSSAPPPSLPPPQPIQARKISPPRPPPPRPPSLKSSSKPPPASHERLPTNGKRGSSSGEVMSESGNSQVKLKPLHWERMSSDADHSMGRDKADAGSYRVDQDLMVALFGTVAISRRSPKGKTDSASQSREVSSKG